MKKSSLLLASLLLSATIGQAQTQSGGGASGGTATGGQSSRSGRPGGTQQAPGVNQNNSSQAPVDINRTREPRPDERILFDNEQPPQFGATNQVQFGATNRPSVAATNPAFGTTNPPFGTRNIPAFGQTNVPPGAFTTNRAQSPVVGRGGLINEAAGARATNRPGQGTGAGDQVFAQQLRAALSRTGATQIFFPQTRSTVTVVNQNGTVTLRGYVANEEERRNIEARVQGTPGITSVNNQLQLASGTPRGIDPAAFPVPGTTTNRQALPPSPSPAPVPAPTPTP